MNASVGLMGVKPLQAPNVWNKDVYIEEERVASSAAQNYGKVVRIVNKIFIVLALATILSGVAAIQFTPVLISTALFGVLLLSVAIYQFVLPYLLRYPTIEERGMIVDIPTSIWNKAWQYDTANKKLTIPHLGEMCYEERKALIEQCVQKNIAVTFQDLTLPKSYDPKKQSDFWFSQAYAKIMKTAVHLVPHKVEDRQDYQVINRMLAALTLYNSDGSPIPPFCQLADPDTLLLNTPKGGSIQRLGKTIKVYASEDVNLSLTLLTLMDTHGFSLFCNSQGESMAPFCIMSEQDRLLLDTDACETVREKFKGFAIFANIIESAS